MKSVVLAVAIGLLLSSATWFSDILSWGWALFLALPIFSIAAAIVIARILGRKLQGPLQQLKRQMEEQRFELARQTLQDLLPIASWVPMLRGQLEAQLGVLVLQSGDEARAIELLGKAPPRIGDAKLLLASLLYRKGDKAACFAALAAAAKVNKKHSLLHNAYAWLLNKEERIDEAIVVLADYTKKQLVDEIAKDNLLRLQNKKRMNMRGFDLNWYALGLERPPADMQMQQVRKGFRTPPMRRGG